MGLKLYLQQLTVKKTKQKTLKKTNTVFFLFVFSYTENPSRNI